MSQKKPTRFSGGSITKYEKSKREEMLKEMRKKIFTKDGKPKCFYCGKPMKNAKDSITGKMSKYLWKCDCPSYPKNMILSVG